VEEMLKEKLTCIKHYVMNAKKEFYNVKKICAVCGNEFIAKQKDV